MKTTPNFIVGVTAFAALTAGVLLAVEDPALFDPKQAMLVNADEHPADAMDGLFTAPPRAGFSVSRPASPVVQPLRQ